MDKKKNIVIVIILFVIILLVGGILLFMSNKSDNNNNSNNNISDDINDVGNNSNTKNDFWLADASIPSETYDLKVKLFDDFTSAPIDLKKLDNLGYTFSYTDYDSGSPIDYNVNSVSDIKGKDWYSSSKSIKVKNSSDELEFALIVKSSCNNNKYSTYEDAINNNCFTLSLNENKIFNKEFNYTNTEGAKEIVQEIFNQLGKPSHIYVGSSDKLTMDGDGVGQLSCDIVYDYGSFKLMFWLLDSYNKKYDFRLLNYYGLNYITNEAYEISSSRSKDIIDEIIK